MDRLKKKKHHICIDICLKSSFPNRDKNHSKKYKYRCHIRRLCFGKELFTYVYRYEELFSKTGSLNLALALQT